MADSVRKILRTLSATKPRTSDGKPSYNAAQGKSKISVEHRSSGYINVQSISVNGTSHIDITLTLGYVKMSKNHGNRDCKAFSVHNLFLNGPLTDTDCNREAKEDTHI